MAPPCIVAVIDIGKTNAKVALVDLASLSEVALRRTSNRLRTDGPYPHHDEEMLWIFVLDCLASLNREHPIEAISVTTHGATAALIDAGGGLAMPILDYEHDGPQETAAAYAKTRPVFAETGSPLLPAGLNLGAQLFWQAKRFPDAFGKAAHILTYPQYWSFRLSGIRAGERTSLGVHSDLWNPGEGTFSSLVGQMGWQHLMPPIRQAFDALGPIEPSIARRTGIAAGCPVFCGIHDSNASLLPYILKASAPFSVVSTGTWVIAMAVGGGNPDLDERRDTLINVDAFGRSVPSARFMGGREFEIMTGAGPPPANAADFARIVEAGIMLLPSVAPGTGPFPDRRMVWAGGHAPDSPGETVAAVSAYLALMTATCLDLIAAAGSIHVEGPFAANSVFLHVLKAACARPVCCSVGRPTGTSIGAALLADPSAARPPLQTFEKTEDTALRAYVARWMASTRL